MTHDETLTMLYEETLVGNAPAVKDGVNQGLELGSLPLGRELNGRAPQTSRSDGPESSSRS